MFTSFLPVLLFSCFVPAQRADLFLLSTSWPLLAVLKRMLCFLLDASSSPTHTPSHTSSCLPSVSSLQVKTKMIFTLFDKDSSAVPQEGPDGGHFLDNWHHGRMCQTQGGQASTTLMTCYWPRDEDSWVLTQS